MIPEYNDIEIEKRVQSKERYSIIREELQKINKKISKIEKQLKENG